MLKMSMSLLSIVIGFFQGAVAEGDYVLGVRLDVFQDVCGALWEGFCGRVYVLVPGWWELSVGASPGFV